MSQGGSFADGEFRICLVSLLDERLLQLTYSYLGLLYGLDHGFQIRPCVSWDTLDTH
jgi:hypothetical protein